MVRGSGLRLNSKYTEPAEVKLSVLEIPRKGIDVKSYSLALAASLSRIPGFAICLTALS